jgi:hypothetical protein
LRIRLRTCPKGERVPGKSFQPRLMFAGKVRAYQSEAPFRCSFLGKAPGLTHKQEARLVKLAKEYALSYYEHSQITVVKRFIPLDP